MLIYPFAGIVLILIFAAAILGLTWWITKGKSEEIDFDDLDAWELKPFNPKPMKKDELIQFVSSRDFESECAT